jgi:hypothetical protein
MDELSKNQTTGRDSGESRSTASDPGSEVSEMNALLDALGKLAREEQASGLTLSPSMIPALSATDKDRIANRIIEVQLGERRYPGALAAVGSTFRLVAKKPRPSPAIWKLAFGGVAAAAAVLVLVMNGPSQDHYSALPDYGVTATGGVKTLRGGPSNGQDEETAVAAVQVLGADTELKVYCRPQTAVGGALAVRAFFVHDGKSSEIRPGVRIASTGAIELSARANDVFEGVPAHGNVRVVVGRPETVRAMNPNLALEGTPPAKDVRWLTVPVEAR